ncbi:MAG TPA: NUDIX domain-containing protein [Candidatus Limnocylindria bacterium]|nr:NUDIX domain-containing protein [Candidatus Limnocylindria bacterium]
MRAGAFAVIFDHDRRVLLCHRRDIDAWNLPGGGVEDGEAPWQAATREVREETGLETEVVRLTGVYWKADTGETVFNFESRVVSGTPHATDESDEVRYFPIAALPPNTAPKQVERIHDAARGGGPYLRAQAGLTTRDVVGRR